MNGTQGPLITARDASLLAWHLACVSGALSEIATTWRRAQTRRPDLPPGLPQRLADTALRLAMDTRSFSSADRGRTPDVAASLAGQMTALRADIASARPRWAPVLYLLRCFGMHTRPPRRDHGRRMPE